MQVYVDSHKHLRLLEDIITENHHCQKKCISDFLSGIMGNHDRIDPVPHGRPYITRIMYACI